MAEFHEKVIIDAICIRTTEKAILVVCGHDEEEHWIPKSQIDDDSEVYKVGDVGNLIISEWFASKEGIS